MCSVPVRDCSPACLPVSVFLSWGRQLYFWPCLLYTSKTAAFLLNEFGTLDNILANAEKIEKPFIKDSIIRNAERLKTNYRLIKLGSKVPLPFVLYELKYSYNGITTNEVLKGIKLR